MDLQGVGLQHLHGLQCLLRADGRSDIGQDEGARGPVSDDVEAVRTLGVTQGHVLGTAGDRDSRLSGRLGQTGIDSRCCLRSAGHGVDVERDLPAAAQDGGADIDLLGADPRQAVMDEGDVVEGAGAVLTVQTHRQLQVLVLTGGPLRGDGLVAHGVTLTGEAVEESARASAGSAAQAADESWL